MLNSSNCSFKQFNRLAAMHLTRSGLFDTKNRRFAASSTWGLLIFLLCDAIQVSQHYPHSALCNLKNSQVIFQTTTSLHGSLLSQSHKTLSEKEVSEIKLLHPKAQLVQ